MEGYYEHNRDTETFPSCWVSENNTCLPHFHSSVEITYVLGGTIDFILNGRGGTACAGQVVVAPSYTVHCFTTQGTSRSIVLLAPLDYVPSFRRHTAHRTFAGSVWGRHGPAARAAALHAPPLHALLYGRARAAGAAHEGLPLHGARRPRGGPRPEAGRGGHGRLSRPRHPAISRPPLPLRRHAGNARGTVRLQQEPVFPTCFTTISAAASPST